MELLGKKIEEMTIAANTAVLVDHVSPSTQVAAVYGKTKELNAEVEQLEMWMPTAQYVSAEDLLSRLDQAPTEEHEQVTIQLEQKSGWLYKKGGMIIAAYQERYFLFCTTACLPSTLRSL